MGALLACLVGGHGPCGLVASTVPKCKGEPWILSLSQLINISYLYLFGNLYVQLYHTKRGPSPKGKGSSSKDD
jgi:hypothetical protein